MIMIVLATKFIFYVKDPNEVKYQHLTKNVKTMVFKTLKTQRLFFNIEIKCRISIKNIEEYNPGRMCKGLIVFHDMIADMIGNKNLNQIVTELFITGRKLNIYTVSITKSCFSVPKHVRLHFTYFLL